MDLNLKEKVFIVTGGAKGIGAVLTALQGYVSDRTGSINLSFLVPVTCFFVVAWFGHVNRGRHAR